MARRTYYDPLQPLPDSCWLVVRNLVGNILEQRELPAGANLRAEIMTAREQWSLKGWVVEPMNKSSAGFFCSQNGERFHVRIERTDPTKPERASHGTSPLQRGSTPRAVVMPFRKRPP